MYRVYTLKQHQRAIVYRQGRAQAVLYPGQHRIWGQHALEIYDLKQPEADISNPQALVAQNPSWLSTHFYVVQTLANQAALVRVGAEWSVVGANQTRLFWKDAKPCEHLLVALDQDLELPAEWVKRLPQKNIAGLYSFVLAEDYRGLFFVDGAFKRLLWPGRYAFVQLDRPMAVYTISVLRPEQAIPQEELLLKNHPTVVAENFLEVETGANELVLLRWRGKAVNVVPPSSRRLTWKDAREQRFSLPQEAKLPPELASELLRSNPEVGKHLAPHLFEVVVPAEQVGLLFSDSRLAELLTSGHYAYWNYGQRYAVELLDLRLKTLEVSGQEILTRDKVPLRLNLSADYQVQDPQRVWSSLRDPEAYLYKELQFALRAAVGTRTLDELLDDKSALDGVIAQTLQSRLANSGLRVALVGIKDIVLPGEIKSILSRVVEAEKAAQANVIRRREETAATRSMLNTAKVMEDNPVALRLKELEVLERIAEKIDKITVTGGLDSVLSELIHLKK